VSAENAELVRGNIDTMQRALDAYWRDRRSIAAALDAGELWPEWEEAYALLHPDVEWQTMFLGQTFRGFREMALAWDDFLKRVEDYRLTVEDVEDLDGDRVLAAIALAGRGKDSGARLDGHLYQVVTLRDGLVARIQEFTTRDEALEAGGGAA
jgi:ketosteroid isomerase-like protein